LLCKNNNQIFRYNKNTLSLYFISTNSKNKYLPLLQKENIKIKKFIDGDFESIYHFPEEQLSQVAIILKLQTMHKNIFPNFEQNSPIP